MCFTDSNHVSVFVIRIKSRVIVAERAFNDSLQLIIFPRSIQFVIVLLATACKIRCLRLFGAFLNPVCRFGQACVQTANSLNSFSRTPESSYRCRLLTKEEVRYAHFLNQKMNEASLWIDEQARRSGKEYKEIGGLDRHITENNAYEDYEMMMYVTGYVGENHPEYVENDDNIIIICKEQIYKENQRIYGRSRNPFHHDRYGTYFSHGESFRWGYELGIQPCGLFWNIFREIDLCGDWLKMLSIGGLWLDVNFMQRRIVQV